MGWALLLLLLAAAPACATSGTGGNSCTTTSDCPAGQVCIEGTCRGGGSDGDADGDGDAPEGDEGVDGDALPPTAVVTGFASTGGALSGFNGEYRYQFSVGAPQPVGAGATAEGGGWVFGPGGVHRR
jgi:hypothetical protein